MVVSRREVLRGALLLGAFLALPAGRLVRRAGEMRVVRALRGRLYPGPVKPLEVSETVSPGRWAG